MLTPISADSEEITYIDTILIDSKPMGTLQEEDIDYAISIIDDIYNNFEYIDIFDSDGREISSELVIVESYYKNDKAKNIASIFTRISRVETKNMHEDKTFNSLSRSYTPYRGYTDISMYTREGNYLGTMRIVVKTSVIDDSYPDEPWWDVEVPYKSSYAKSNGYSFGFNKYSALTYQGAKNGNITYTITGDPGYKTSKQGYWTISSGYSSGWKFTINCQKY